jgi:hypothetical protein
LVSAKVVLPVELFEENITSSGNNSTNQKVAEREKELAGFIPQEMLEAKEVAEAKITSENIEYLLSELKNIETEQYKAYEEAYNKELKAYQEQIKPAIIDTKKHKEDFAKSRKMKITILMIFVTNQILIILNFLNLCLIFPKNLKLIL